MSIKPILFNTQMVREILYGQKTQTRRVVKEFAGKEILRVRMPDGTEIGKYGKDGWRGELPDRHDGNAYCVEAKPPCKAGDILWVRETWAHPSEPEIRNGADPGMFLYKADCPLIQAAHEQWHPSIHMPREASRIFLRVTDVRMERLQDISVLDAISEGCCGLACDCANAFPDIGLCPDCHNTGWMLRPEIEFALLWNSTIKRKEMSVYGWDANPWVWVIEFERCDKPESW